MNTKNKTVILLHAADNYECFSTLTALCRDKGWSYNYLKKKKPPFLYRGNKIMRLPYLT